MNIAFIPVRGGSKSIPLKNIKELNGYPLVYWTVLAASQCNYIDKVVVSTDSDEIERVVNNFKLSKVEVIERSAETASDFASTESAMLEFANMTEFDNIVLIQATSPLLCEDDLNRGFEEFNTPETDSVLSVVRQKRFNWKIKEDGYSEPMNYDIYRRPRRQEFEGYFVENGAFYITSRDALISSQNRISGNIKIVEMPEDTFFEIDEVSDWVIVENLMKQREKRKKNDFSKIKMFLSDNDGCLTDGGMYYSELGDELKKFNAKDGMGFQILREMGIITGIISGEKIKLLEQRAKKMHIDILEMGIKDKLSKVKEISEKFEIPLENILYIGDDINDLETIRTVGIGCCVHDSVQVVKDNSDYITMAKGGEGAIREVVDLLIKSIKE